MLPIHIFHAVVLEDEERKEDLRRMRRERRIMRSESDPFFMPDDCFVNLFRLTKEMVQHILMPALISFMNEESDLKIVPVHKILITLYFYAVGSYQKSLAQDVKFPTSQQTVSKCIRQVTPLIVTALSEDWIKFPNERRVINKIKQKFMEKAAFPGVIGAIDCTHIAIIAPSIQEHNYLNRKGFHSKNVQIVF